MPTTPACNLKANAKYHANHIKRLPVNLNDRTDQDIIRHLSTVDNVQGYIKALIRADIRNGEIKGAIDEIGRLISSPETYPEALQVAKDLREKVACNLDAVYAVERIQTEIEWQIDGRDEIDITPINDAISDFRSAIAYTGKKESQE